MSSKLHHNHPYYYKLFFSLMVGLLFALFLTSCQYLEKKIMGRENSHSISVNKLRIHPLEADTLIMLVKNGDLVFRKGISMVSRLVTTSDKESIYSHIGLITIVDSIAMVIHAVPGEPIIKGDLDRVKIEPLIHFLSKIRASNALLMRSNISNDTLINTIREAKKYVDHHTLFDHDFKLETDDKVYCTELIYKIFLSQGIDLTEGRRSNYAVPILGGTFLFPSDLEKNKRLTSIYSY